MELDLPMLVILAILLYGWSRGLLGSGDGWSGGGDSGGGGSGGGGGGAD